jgi:hypothetical protein
MADAAVLMTNLVSRVASLRAVRQGSRGLLAAFFIVLSFFCARAVHDKLADLARARTVYHWAEISAGNSLLLHELQMERGLSSGYIASNGKVFADDLVRQRRLTDEARAMAERSLLNDENLNAYLEARHAFAINDLQRIADLRQRVDALMLSREVTVDRYSSMIDMLFDVMGASLVTDDVTLRPQMAFMAFLQAKEMAGQERALLTAILSSRDFGSFSRIAALHRIRAIEEQATDFCSLPRRTPKPALKPFMRRGSCGRWMPSAAASLRQDTVLSARRTACRVRSAGSRCRRRRSMR